MLISILTQVVDKYTPNKGYAPSTGYNTATLNKYWHYGTQCELTCGTVPGYGDNKPTTFSAHIPHQLCVCLPKYTTKPY